MFFFQSALQSLKKYADFKGRASPREFWCFLGFVVVAQAVASFLGLFLFRSGPALSAIVGALLFIPQLAVAVRRLHDVGRSARELWVPCVMLLFVPLAFAFRGILPQIVALGFFGFTLIAFANLLRLFLKQGSRVPNRYGRAPTAFTFADSPA
jgi:uncharacterized membrane protein YhaH (DUF805 family)